MHPVLLGLYAPLIHQCRPLTQLCTLHSLYSLPLAGSSMQLGCVHHYCPLGPHHEQPRHHCHIITFGWPHLVIDDDRVWLPYFCTEDGVFDPFCQPVSALNYSKLIILHVVLTSRCYIDFPIFTHMFENIILRHVQIYQQECGLQFLPSTVIFAHTNSFDVHMFTD